MYQLKLHPEDFIVKEVLKTDILVEHATSYHVYLLRKHSYTTERAIQHLAQALRLPRKAFSYAGTKDKHAVTEQYIVIKGVSKEKVEQLQLTDITLHFVGYASQHLRLGDLAGNRFEIVLRNLQCNLCAPETFMVPNYFDEQRFSTHNVTVGLHLLKKEFKEAVALLVKQDSDFAKRLQEHLNTLPTDFIGALRKLPRKILLFYVHAVQSKIYNELLAATVADGVAVSYSQGVFQFPKQLLLQVPAKQITLPGFDSNDLNDFLQEQLGIVARNFLITSMPELTLEGSTRSAFFEVTDCVISQKQDVATLTFTLPKGSYATIVVRQLVATCESSP